MYWIILADFVVILHLTFILFVLFGGFFGLWRRWMLAIHLVAVCWATSVEFFNLTCPLTPLENSLRHNGNLTVYNSSFVEQYLLPVLYPAHLTKDIQMMLGIFIIVLNVGVYFYIVKKLKASS